MKAKHFASPLLAFGFCLSLTDPTFAQTASSPAAPTAAAPATATPAAPALDTQGRPEAKEVRADCKADAKAKGLKGDDRRKAVMDCVVKQRPDLAAAMAAREQCRADGKAKGMTKDDLKAFVKDCAKAKT